MGRLLLVNFLWIDAADEEYAEAAAVDAMRSFKVEGTLGRVATMHDNEASRELYDEFMAYTEKAFKEIQ